MSLWKRGNVWWAIFYIDHVRYQASTGTNIRRQAEVIEQQFKKEANERRHSLVQVDPKMTFGELAARFIANAGAGPHHLDRLKHLLPYFADVPVVQINKGMVTEYRRYRHSRKSLKGATINRDISVIRHILYWAVDESLLLSNQLTRVRMERERRTRRPVMSVEEEIRLLEVSPVHLKRIVITALDTGMRRGEILNQLWEHVDFNRGLLSVTKSKTPEGEFREIPLTHRVLDLLLEIRLEEGVIFTYGENPIQFIKHSWTTALKEAKIRHIRFHDLRHTFNTRLMEAGVLQEVRMALMGHSSGEKVHSIYTHIELPIKREAIVRLEQWVKHQYQQKGGSHDTTQTDRPVGEICNVISIRAKTLEEEDAGRSRA